MRLNRKYQPKGRDVDKPTGYIKRWLRRNGAINMSQLIQSSIASLPSVVAVSVRTENNRIQVEVTVDKFDWKNLAPIYEKELDLSYAFREQCLDFRVIDESP